MQRHPIIAAVLLLLIAALWLPFGAVGFTADDWFFYISAGQGIGVYATPSRPLLFLAYWVGYQLADGVTGFNLMLGLLLAARSLLVYASLRKLTVGQAGAFAAAALTIFVPADNGYFYMGALNVYLAWVAYFAAFYLLLDYWQTRRLRVAFGMWVSLLVCVGTYEAPYPLIAVSPLALWALERHERRYWLAVLVRWYLFPALYVVFLGGLYLTHQELFAYQQGMAQGNTPASMLDSLLAVYGRHLWGAWVVSPDWAYAPLAGIVGLSTGIVAYWLARED